ncbi:MAG: hypothetical protein ACTSXZ_10365, partial [Alphaproteobacteria bacterium]
MKKVLLFFTVTVFIFVGCFTACTKKADLPAEPATPVAQVTPAAQTTPAAPVESGWMVICGVVGSAEKGESLRRKLAGVVGNRAEIVDTNDYEGLTPNLVIASAGVYPQQNEATGVVEQLAADGVKCYHKQASYAGAIDSANLTFFGNSWLMWFCADAAGEILPYPRCRRA